MDNRSADRPVEQPSGRALQVRDLSEWPTRLLAPSDPAGPTGGAAGSGRQRLVGARAYEQEAAKLQALAQQTEQDLCDCAEHLVQARSRYQHLQTTVGATGAHRYDLELAHLDMESYASVIIRLREDYLALIHRADQYLAAAAIVRSAEHE